MYLMVPSLGARGAAVAVKIPPRRSDGGYFPPAALVVSRRRRLSSRKPNKGHPSHLMDLWEVMQAIPVKRRKRLSQRKVAARLHCWNDTVTDAEVCAAPAAERYVSGAPEPHIIVPVRWGKVVSPLCKRLLDACGPSTKCTFCITANLHRHTPPHP